MLDTKKRGMIEGTLGNVVFGFSYLFTGGALATVDTALMAAGIAEYNDVPVLLAIRSVFALLLMGLLIPLLRIRMDLRGKPVWKLVLLGFFQPVIYFIGETFGLKFTGIVVSSVIISLIPLVCQFASVLFLGEKTTLAQFLFALLSVGGVVTVTLLSAGDAGGSTYLVGVILLIVAVCAASAFSVFGKTVCDVFTPFERTFAMFAVSAVCFGVYSLFAVRGHFTVFVAPFATPSFIVQLIYLGGLSSVLAFFLTNAAKKHLSVTREAIFSNVITVVSTASGFIFQPTGKNLWLSAGICVLIIVGIVGVQIFTPKTEEVKK